MTEHIYCGQGKQGKYDSISLTIFPDDLSKINEHAQRQGADSPVFILVAQRKQPSPKGYTHYLRIVERSENEMYGDRNREHSDNRTETPSRTRTDTNMSSDIPF